jgi:hypothetical protein
VRLQGFAGVGMATLPTADKVTFEVIEQAETKIETILECDVIHCFGELRAGMVTHYRDVVEALAGRDGKRNALGICLTTPGGQAEVVEKLVEITRHHYDFLYFIVPNMAMSAGTIFCMAGDKIYMDYSSSLGPIDPQVPEKDEKYLVPALGYLDKIAELIEKSRDGTISPAEFMLIEKQDLAMLRFYEQARDLSITLLKDWLATYKFKDWTTHRTTNPGSPVTEEDKTTRAREIAELLSDNKYWHSHGRLIGMKKLREVVRLEIEDFGSNRELSEAIRRYSDVLTRYLNQIGAHFFVYSRHTAF